MAEPFNTQIPQKNAWYIRDKGQLYKFDRMIQTPTGQAKTYLYKKIDMYGAVEKTYSPYGSEIPVLYRYGIKKQKVGEYFITTTVKFSPKDHECYGPDCSYRTCPDFARNDKGSTDEQKLNKRILTRFKIKQIDLEDEMIVKVTKKKIIYKDVGIRFTRVTPLIEPVEQVLTPFEQIQEDYPIQVQSHLDRGLTPAQILSWHSIETAEKAYFQGRAHQIFIQE